MAISVNNPVVCWSQRQYSLVSVGEGGGQQFPVLSRKLVSFLLSQEYWRTIFFFKMLTISYMCSKNRGHTDPHYPL